MEDFYFLFILFFSPTGASGAAIALHSWAAKISHIADACISSACLSFHIPKADSRMPFTTEDGGQAFVNAPHCYARQRVFASVSRLKNFGGIRKRLRQWKTSLRGSWSGYSIRSASEMGAEEGEKWNVCLKGIRTGVRPITFQNDKDRNG